MKNIHSILNDLYMLEPSLKDHQEELEKMLEQFMKLKPDLQINEEFVRELKEKLNHEATFLNHENKNHLTHKSFSNMMKKLLLPFAGGVLATALIIVVFQNFNSVNPQNLEESEAPMLAMENEIIKVEPNAFGPLTNLGASEEKTMAQSNRAEVNGTLPPQASNGPSVIKNEEDVSENEEGRVTFDVATPTDSVAISTPGSNTAMGMGGNIAIDQKMNSRMIDPDYVPTVYKYTYAGAPVDLSSPTVNVYKRITVKAESGTLANTLKNFGFGLMDLGGFKNTRAETITLIQDEKLGYSISLNFNDSSINIYQNWMTWDHPTSKCGNDQKCYEDNRLKKEDIPADAQLISIADNFLKEHKLNASAYGQPVIQKYWEREIAMLRAQGQPEGEFYVPDTINVVYPLLLDGNPVSDQSGNPMGLYVGVNIFHKKVASVNNLRVDQFQSSAYDAITDWATIEKYLAQGGTPYPNYYGENQKVKEVEIKLEKPEVILMNTWQYKENENNEFFTPALRFSVIQPEGEYFYQDSVVVPLAKDLLQQYDYARPMPMIEAQQDAAVSNPPIPANQPQTEPSTTPVIPKG